MDRMEKTDLEMIKYLLAKSGKDLEEDIETCRYVKLLGMVNGKFTRLKFSGEYADGVMLFDEDGNILDFEIYG